MRADFARAFEEWDRRYRENPQAFMSSVEHLLQNTSTTYGAACAVYFEALLNEQAAGQAGQDEPAG